MEVIKSRIQAMASKSSYRSVNRTDTADADAVDGEISTTSATHPVKCQCFLSETIYVISQTIRTEGVFGLYRGYWLTLLVFIPYSSLFFVVYEYLKTLITNASEHWWYLLFCGMIASGVSAVISNVPDVVKTRYQVDDFSIGENASPSSKTWWMLAVAIYRSEGPLGFVKGALARALWMIPHTTISMATFDYVVHLWR